MIEDKSNKLSKNIIYIEDDEEERDDLIDSILVQSQLKIVQEKEAEVKENLFFDDKENISDNEDFNLNDKEEVNSNDDIAVKNALKLAKEMRELINHIPCAKEILKNELSVLDRAQEDILSKIETDKFNVVDGYQLIKQLKEIRIKRRTVKNNLFVYESLYNIQIPKEKTLTDVVLRAQNIEGEVRYKPRVLKNIDYKFNDNKNSKFKDIKREDLLSLDY